MKIKARAALIWFLIDFLKGKNIDFPKVQTPEIAKPHVAFKPEILQKILDAARDNLEINALVLFLYDTAGRIQDAEELLAA